MGLRDRLRSSVRTVMDRFSGEYSAASDAIHVPSPAEAAADTPDGEVKVTRARLKRPRDAKESQETP